MPNEKRHCFGNVVLDVKRWLWAGHHIVYRTASCTNRHCLSTKLTESPEHNIITYEYFYNGGGGGSRLEAGKEITVTVIKRK